jgi:hypothetical protein
MTKQLVIVFAGDSIAAVDDSWTYQSIGATGNGGSGNQLMESLACYRKSDGSILVMNMAVAGSGLSVRGFPDLVQLAPGYIDPIVANKTIVGAPSDYVRKYLFVNAIGSNDGGIDGLGSVANYAAANAAAAVARKTAGFDLCAMTTLLPRLDTATMVESNRLAYNTLLRDSSWRASNGIDFLVDIASEATMGDPANVSNTTYYGDGMTHPTTFGYSLIAVVAASEWTTILASF